jgi:predicted nuclease of predicted toxin-antitoxin system
VAHRLLLDENLSPVLARSLADLFPGSAHVRDLSLAAADDESIWGRAAADGFVIVTKDDDFRQRSFLRGAPPKVVWLRLGNCRTAEIENAIRLWAPEIREFADDAITSLLVLTRRS